MSVRLGESNRHCLAQRAMPVGNKQFPDSLPLISLPPPSSPSERMRLPLANVGAYGIISSRLPSFSLEAASRSHLPLYQLIGVEDITPLLLVPRLPLTVAFGDIRSLPLGREPSIDAHASIHFLSPLLRSRCRHLPPSFPATGAVEEINLVVPLVNSAHCPSVECPPSPPQP